MSNKRGCNEIPGTQKSGPSITEPAEVSLSKTKTHYQLKWATEGLRLWPLTGGGGGK